MLFKQEVLTSPDLRCCACGAILVLARLRLLKMENASDSVQ